MTSACTPSRSWSLRRAAGSQTLAGAASNPLRLCSGTLSDGTPAPKNPATGTGVMFSQTKNSPSFPLNPLTVFGACSLNFRSTRSAHIVGGSTKCESAEITRWSAINHSPPSFVPVFNNSRGNLGDASRPVCECSSSAVAVAKGCTRTGRQVQDVAPEEVTQIIDDVAHRDHPHRPSLVIDDRHVTIAFDDHVVERKSDTGASRQRSRVTRHVGGDRSPLEVERIARHFH